MTGLDIISTENYENDSDLTIQTTGAEKIFLTTDQMIIPLVSC